MEESRNAKKKQLHSSDRSDTIPACDTETHRRMDIWQQQIQH